MRIHNATYHLGGADVDGMHIRLLIITFFLQFFPDLIKKVNSHVDTKKKPPELLQVRRLQSKTAATYSPTVTQYHRRDKA